MTPKQAWMCLVVVLIIYSTIASIITIFFYPDYLLFTVEIGILVFTILALYISTRENIEEMRRSTKIQIEILQKGIEKQIEVASVASEREAAILREGFKAIVGTLDSQNEEILNELKKINSGIKKLVEETGKQIEEAKEIADETKEKIEVLKSLEEQRRTAEMEQIQRIKPDLHVYIEARSHWLFWTHYWMMMSNIGGNAQDVRIQYRFHERSRPIRKGPFVIRTNSTPVEWDFGDVDDINRKTASIFVTANARDEQRRLYKGSVLLSLDYRGWVKIPLQPA